MNYRLSIISTLLRIEIYNYRITLTDKRKGMIKEQNNSVCIATGYGLDDWGTTSAKGKHFIVFYKFHDSTRTQPSNRYWGPYSLWQSLKLMVHLFLGKRRTTVGLHLHSLECVHGIVGIKKRKNNYF
jgi:hypothetical protein